jgi:hypothetical protein
MNRKKYYQWKSRGKPLKETRPEWKPEEDINKLLEDVIK